jgi:hypothetical protein
MALAGDAKYPPPPRSFVYDLLLMLRDSDRGLLHYEDASLLFPSRNSLVTSDLHILSQEWLLLLLSLRYELLEGRSSS